MSRNARSGKWRGRANQGSREKRRHGRGRKQAEAESQLEGEVRWIDREGDAIHVLVTRAEGVAEPWVGEVVEIGYARPRLRLRIVDRDRDGRLDGDDMVLGDKIRASGVKVRRSSAGVLNSRVEVRRLEVS